MSPATIEAIAARRIKPAAPNELEIALTTPDMEHLGWTEDTARAFGPYAHSGLVPARVAVEHRDAYVLYSAQGEMWAEISGSLRHEATGRADLPAVGDWVAVMPRPGEKRATIRAVLERRSSFARKEAGFEVEQQVLAANMDVVFLVAGLDGNLNTRRLERYLVLAWGSGASPIIVLNKADLCPDVPSAVAEVEGAAPGVPTLVVSAVDGRGIDELRAYLLPHRTGVLLGSSGVGKSTLMNQIHGRALQKVERVREDGKGRHTTTHRELFAIPGGGLLIDTPGMRELQLWDEHEGLEETFDDVTALAQECRFSDCSHEVEPGCAVAMAVKQGRLERDRLDSYHKLLRELRFLERKRDQRAAIVEKRRIKAMTKSYRRTHARDA